MVAPRSGSILCRVQSAGCKGSGLANLLMSRIFLCVLLTSSIMASCSGASQALVITGDEMLPACPESPNCVSSQASDTAKRVDPFPIKNDLSHSMERLNQIILSMSRMTVVTHSETVLQVEFKSLLGFVDDLVFMVSEKEEAIHVRSASRTGKWDLGVNRRRVERIRKLYLAEE